MLNNWVFDFGVCISLRVFVFLAVGFRFAEEMPAIFRILYPIRFFWNGNCSFEDFSISSNVRTDKLVQFLGLNLVQIVEKFRIGILNLGIYILNSKTGGQILESPERQFRIFSLSSLRFSI